MAKEQYDLFHTREAAELYSKHQPALCQRVVDMILKQSPDKGCFLDLGWINSSNNNFNDNWMFIQ